MDSKERQAMANLKKGKGKKDKKVLAMKARAC